MHPGFFPDMGGSSGDRERIMRILGVAGLLATAAVALLGMGIAAGTLVFRQMESASSRPETVLWDTAAALQHEQARP